MTVENKVSISELVKCPTVGDGYCAFHAMFGEWDAEKRAFLCADHHLKRAHIADLIKGSAIDSPLMKKVKIAIQQMIMDNKHRAGAKLIAAQQAYADYSAQEKRLSAPAKALFESTLTQHPDVMAYIESFIQEHIACRSLPADNIERLQQSLFLRFDTCLKEDRNVLTKMISENRSLQEAYTLYQHTGSTFNWNEILNDADVIKEYANFIEQDGRWLLPCEIDLVAHALGCTVHFYNGDITAPTSYNSGKGEPTPIRFNGINHYEKMIKKSAALSSNSHEDFKREASSPAWTPDRSPTRSPVASSPLPSFRNSHQTIKITPPLQHKSPAIQKRMPKVEKARDIDFSALAKTVSAIDKSYELKLQMIKKEQVDAQQALGTLKLFSNEKVREQAIASETANVQKLTAALDNTNEDLKNAKKRTVLLEQRLHALQQEQHTHDFDGDVDKKVEWVVKREALQTMQAEIHADAARRKVPLQNATLAGRLKVEQDVETRLTQTIKEMAADYKSLEEKQAVRHAEHQYLIESLTARRKELETCVKDQSQKQSLHDQSKTDVANHQLTIASEIKKYKDTLHNLNTSLNSATNTLHTLESQRDALNVDIRQAEIAIQQLQANINHTIQVPTSQLQNHRTWHGHLWGWRDNHVWVTVNVPTVVPNPAVIAAIAVKQAHVVAQKASLAATNASIISKNAEIVKIQSDLTKHEEAWKTTKNTLDKENWRLEDAEKKAESELDLSKGRKSQKENEITHLEESKKRKEDEITHAQRILDDRKNTLVIFNKDLTACQARIQQVKEESQRRAEAADKLPPAQNIDTTVETDKALALVQAKLDAKSALDNARREETQLEASSLALQTQLTAANAQLLALTNPREKTVAAKRQDEELKHKAKIENAERELVRMNEDQCEMLHALLLGQGLVLSGYQATNKPLDNLIICLLQGVFESYPSYLLSNTVNLEQPATWQRHLAKIKSKLAEKKIEIPANDQAVSSELITAVVDVINDEYQADNTVLQVSISGRPLETKAWENKNVVSLNLWQKGAAFYLWLPESLQHKEEVKEEDQIKRYNKRAHDLTTALLSPHQTLRALCEKVILRDCAKSLTECAPETLANYCREELQRDRAKNKHSNESLFRTLFKTLFDGLVVPQNLSCDVKEIQLQAAHHCLATLNEIYEDLPKEQQQDVYHLCLQQYLTELKLCITGELKRRAESESNAKRLLDESKAELANKMHGLEKEMQEHEQMIAKLEADIIKKEADLQHRKTQAKDLEQHYQQQASEIETDIQHLLKVKDEVQNELEKLMQNADVNEQRITELKELQKQTRSDLEKLQSEKKEVLHKIKEARDAKLALETEQIEVDTKKKMFEKIRAKSEVSKAREDQKIKFLETWRAFLKGIHEHLLNDQPAFINRRALLAKSVELLRAGEGNRLLSCFNYFMSNIPCLKKFDTQEIRTCIEQSVHDDYSMLSANWTNDLNNVLEDVLGSPTFSSEVISPLTIKGNNIAWSEVSTQLKAIIEKRLSLYGLGFNAQNKLVLKNAALVGKINELPDALKKLLSHHVSLHCQHYTIVHENRVVQTPRWREIENLLTEQELLTIINRACIDFTEVVRAHVDSIEVVAGHNLYLDADVFLPGINVTFFSKDKIHCKDNLVINTSAKQFVELSVPRAKAGDEYQAESGREGDDGLDGVAGDCAGHVILKAENTIENLPMVKIIANGANGLKGQCAGIGGKGHKGVDMPDAQATDTDGFGKAQFRIAYGRVPGMDAHGKFTKTNEFSGAGGNAGLAGLGGGAGLPGDVVIMDSKNEIQMLAGTPNVLNGEKAQDCQKNIEQKKGSQGVDADRDAKGGEPGEAGATGADHVLSKKSFFKKTESWKGQVTDDVYDHPSNYIEPDEACGLHISPTVAIIGMFNSPISQQGYSERCQKEVIGTGYYVNVPIRSNQNPRRDDRSRRDRGKHNSEADRKKAADQRKNTKQSQTIQNQMAQISRINQMATSIQQNHVVNKYDNDYETEIAKYRARSEQLAQEIEQCKSQEAQCAQRSAEISTQLQAVNQTIGQLDSQLQQINQLETQLNGQLTANDLAQLENLRQMAERGAERIQAQANLACANIDVNCEQGLSVQFQQLHTAIQNALQACQNQLSQDIQGTKAARLLQRESLLSLQAEYARLEKSYNENASQKTDENHLNRLAEELSHIEQKKEKSELSEQVIRLSDGVASEDKSTTMLSELEQIEKEEREVLLKLPTQQEQCEKVLNLFSAIFGERGRYRELAVNLSRSTTEGLWEIALKSIAAELPIIRDKDGTIKRFFSEFRHLLKYGENVIKASSFSIETLLGLYAETASLMLVLEKDESCMLLLKSLSHDLENNLIDKLSERCVKNSHEGKEKARHKHELQKILQTALLSRTQLNPPLTQKQQLNSKFEFFKSFISLITKRADEKMPKPFAELLMHTLENTSQAAPLLPKGKDVFKAEVKDLLAKFGIASADEKTTSSQIFEQLQLEIEYFYVKTTTMLETLQSEKKEGTSSQDLQIQLMEVRNLLAEGKQNFQWVLDCLSNAISPYSKTLLKQAAKSRQILAIMQAKLAFSSEKIMKANTADKKCPFDPVARCKILEGLYTGAQTCIKTASKEFKQELKNAAQQTLTHFIQTAALSPEEWLEILNSEKNKNALLVDGGFLCLTLFQRIIASQDSQSIMLAFETCNQMIESSDSNKESMKEVLGVLAMSALAEALNRAKERFIAKAESDSKLVETVNDQLKLISGLADLWFSDHCLLTVGKRFAAMELLKKGDVSANNLQVLRNLLNEHYSEQKRMLLAGVITLEHKEDKSTITNTNKPKVIHAKTGQFVFDRHVVQGGEDSAYTAFSITRHEAHALITENLNNVRILLVDIVKKALRDVRFIDYLEERAVAGEALRRAFQNYQTAVCKGGEIDGAVISNLYRYAEDLAIIQCYVDYDIRDRKVDAGWSHPRVLQALSHLQGIELHLWQVNNDQDCIPHRQAEYASYKPKNAKQRIDLLFLNNNHFERLQLRDSAAIESSIDKAPVVAVSKHEKIVRSPVNQLSERIEQAIKNIEICLKDVKHIAGSGSQHLQDLDKCLVTLQLLLNNSPDLISNNDLALIEKSYHLLSQLLITHRYGKETDKQTIGFWMLVRNQSEFFQRIVNDRFFTLMVKRLDDINSERKTKRETLANLMEDITKHYEVCVKAEKVKLHPSAQTHFINYLLKKLENLYFSAHADNAVLSMTAAMTEFNQIKSDIIKMTSVDEIERHFINRVNQKALGASAAALFGKITCPVAELSTKLDVLKTVIHTNAGIDKILTAWLESTSTLMAYLNKETDSESLFIENSWLVQFLNDSNTLFSELVPESEAQEMLLLDREMMFQSWLDRIANQRQPEKFAALQKLLRTLRLSTPKSDYYIHSTRLLALLSKKATSEEVDAAWKKSADELMVNVSKTFDMINVDQGSVCTRSDVTTQILAMTPAYTLAECSQMFATMNAYLQQAQSKITVIDKAAPADNGKNNISKRLLAFTFSTAVEGSTLRKLYLNLMQLAVKDLEDIKPFVQRFIAYQSGNNQRNAEQVVYGDLLATQLANLYASKYLNVKEGTDEAKLIVSHVTQAEQINQRPDISLEIYFRLCEAVTPSNSPRKIINAKNSAELIKTLLNPACVTSEAIYLEFRNALLESENQWKIPYFMAMLPLLPVSALAQTRVEEILKSLFNPGVTTTTDRREETKVMNFKRGHLNIDLVNRLRLLQITLAYYVRNHLLAKLDKAHINRDVIVRMLSYMDRLFTEAFNAHAQAQSPRDVLFKIETYYGYMQKLADKPFDQVKGIDIQNLLTPIELSLAKSIKKCGKTSITTLLNTSSPKDWNTLLRKKYFETIENVFLISEKEDLDTEEARFSELFTEAYVVAQRVSPNEAAWLNCVNYLHGEFIKSQLSLADVNHILGSVVSVGSFEHVYHAINAKLHPSLVVRECLYQECVHAVKHCLNDEKQLERILAKLAGLKLAIFNEDHGHLLLHKLSNALLYYRNVEKSNLYPSYLHELLELISETQAYKHTHLLQGEDNKYLNNKNILRWNYQLKREKTIQLFSLQKERTSRGVDTLVHHLNQLGKEKKPFCDRLVKLIQRHIIAFDAVSLVNGFIVNFVNHYWELDENVLVELEQTAPEKWRDLLNSRAEARLATQAKQALGDRTPAVIVEEMRKELEGINKPVQPFLEAKDGNASYIEMTIAAIQSKYNSDTENWSEAQIADWVINFKKNGVQNFSDHTKVVEFAAVLMRACKIKANKIPRPTQLTALLLFIDSIQKGKGRLANISTGEGKSLITVMTAIVLALRNEKVDVITSNELLAERDAKSLEPLFQLFGIKVSNNCDNDCEKNENLRKERYTECQVIYGTTSSFQRDLLLTNFFGKPIRGQQGQASLGNTLLIDEVDSMFIDNAEKILYISHPIQDLRHLNDLFLMIWAAVNSAEHAQEREGNVEEVAKFIQKQIDDKSIIYPKVLKEFVDRRLTAWIKNAYLAKRMEEGKEYIIPKKGEKHNKVVIMDLDTGVEQTTTQWSNGLHQFIQLKHSQKLSQESLKAVFMSNAVFFQAYHGHIIGMTGTLGSEVEMELMSNLYGIDYFRLPRNKPERYLQEEPIIVETREAWKMAMVEVLKSKQCVLTDKNEDASQLLKEKIEAAQKQLTVLEAKKTEIVKALDNARAKVTALNQDIEVLIAQLARDVAIDKDSTCNRDAFLANKNNKTIELEASLKGLQEHEKALEKLMYGEGGIANTKNDIRNIEFELANTGARPILLVCANVKEVHMLASIIEKDPALSKCKITLLTSKDDPQPEHKLGPNEIIIATNIAARGVDFETLPIVEKNGGLCVIPSSIPKNIRIETQIFKRTARNGNSGSGKFVVCSDGINTTVDALREIRDIEEARRLDKIRTQGIPKLIREQHLFEKFIELQRKIKEKLESELKDPKEFDQKALQVQLKSLQNKWAFFLDKMEKDVANIDGVSEVQLTAEFNKFEADIWQLMNAVPFRLISEPSEFMRMARYAMDTKIKKDFSDEAGYRLATEYLDAIIEKDPQFAGFAHYYKAHCNFGQKRNDLQSKSAARRSLKQAIDLLEDKIARLSTAAQFIRVLRGRKQESGLGLEVDDFSKAISGEVSLIQVHINAAREALGTELTADSFKSGTVTGDENKVVFENVRAHLRDVIKGHRLSKKALIKALADYQQQEKIYVNDKPIDLPPMSTLAREAIITRIKARVGAVLEKRTEVIPDLFKDLFISKQQFLDGVGASRYSKQPVFKLHADAKANAKGKWDSDIFSDVDSAVSQKIKEEILDISIAMSEVELIAKMSACGVTAEKAKSMIQYLKDKSILTSNDIYTLSDEVKGIINDYKHKIILRERPNIDVASLKLDSFPEFQGKIESITKALNAGAQLTAENLQLNEKAFVLLFHLLKENKCFKSTLIERLSLHHVFTNPAHHRDIENELLRIFESNQAGDSCDVLLCEDAIERVKQLWSYLKSMKVVKDPSVRFKLNNDPEKLLDGIKQKIKDSIGELIKDKSVDDQKKYIDSIYSTIEKAVGKIKQFEKLKIDPKTLQDFLSGGKVPPELTEFTNECYDIVLSLAEDKGWSWGAFFVALLGIIQIAAGVIIGALTFGAAAFISAVLISEGIGDLIFAVQSGISGNFSWSAYGERKWQSLLISVATAGIGVGIGAITGAAASAASSTVSAIAQKFVVQLAEAGLACALSLATDQLVKQVLTLVLNELDKNFEQWVKGSATFQSSEKRLQVLIGNLFDKFGADQARNMINDIMVANAQKRTECFENVFTGKLTETLQKLSSSLSIVAGQLEKSGNSTAAIIGTIAKIAGHVATGADIINKFRDIASLTPETLKALEESLERAYHKSAPSKEEVALVNAGKSKESFCTEILDRQTAALIKEIKSFLQRAVLQPATQSLLQMAVKPVNEMLNQELMENLKKMEKSTPASTLPGDDISALADFPAADKPTADSNIDADGPDNNSDATPKAQRSPAGSADHAKKAQTFAERTKHGSNANIGVTHTQNLSSGGEFFSGEQVISGPFCSNDSFSLLREDQYRRLESDLPVEQSFDLFDVVGAGQLAYGVAKLAPHIPGLVKSGSSFFMNKTATHMGQLGFFKAPVSNAASIENIELMLDKAARSAREVNANTFFGKNPAHMRYHAQKAISENPNSTLKVLLNDKGTFHPTRGVPHSELMNNPTRVQMGHQISKASGATEKVMIQGAWENQFNAITIERSSIGGFVENPVVDIEGFAFCRRTVESWKR